MDDIEFEHVCPDCGQEYIASMPSDSSGTRIDVKCEDCGKRYGVVARVEIVVNYEEYRY